MSMTTTVSSAVSWALMLFLQCLMIIIAAEGGQQQTPSSYIQTSIGFSMISPIGSRTADPPLLFGRGEDDEGGREMSLNPSTMRGLVYDASDFHGGFLGGCTDGEYIYMVPYAEDPPRLRRISRKTGHISDGSDFTWPSGLTFTIKKGAFCGCAFDGFRGLWLISHQATSLVRVDTISKEMTLYDNWPENINFALSHRFCGSIIDPRRNHLWLMPYGASHPVKVSNFLSTPRMSPQPPPTVIMEGRFDYPSSLKPGSRGVPFSTGVLAEDSIWFVPNDAALVVEMPLDGRPMIAHGRWPQGVYVGASAFLAGVYDDPGKAVWLVPNNAKHIVKIDIYSGAMKAFNGWPNGVAASIPKLAFGSAVFDGKHIWISNHAYSHLLMIDTQSGAMSQLGWPRAYKTRSGNLFGSIVFDGDSLWLIPRDATQVVRFVDTTRTHVVQNGIAYDGWQRSEKLFANASLPPIAARFKTLKSSCICATRVGNHIWIVSTFNTPISRIHTVTGATTYIPWQGKIKYPPHVGAWTRSGVNDGQGLLWLIPRFTTQLAAINTTSPFTIATYDLPDAETQQQRENVRYFSSACLNTMEQIVMAPDTFTKVGVFDLASSQFQFYGKWPTGISATEFTKSSNSALFFGAVCNPYDATTYLIPYRWTHLVKFNPLVADDAAKLTLLSTDSSWPAGFGLTSEMNFFGAILTNDDRLWLTSFGQKTWVSVKLPGSGDPSSKAVFTGHHNWPSEAYVSGTTVLYGATFDGHSVFATTRGSGRSIVAVNTTHPDAEKMKALPQLPMELDQPDPSQSLVFPLFDGVSIWVPDRYIDSGVRLIDREKVLFLTDGFSQIGLIPRAGTMPLPSKPENIISQSHGSVPFLYLTVYDGVRYIYLPPFYEQDAATHGLLRVDVETGERATILTSWPGMDFKKDQTDVVGVTAFGGGVLVGAEHIYLVPGTKRKVVRVNLNDNTITVLETEFPGIHNSHKSMPFCGGAFDGEWVWMFPRRAWGVLRVNTITHEMEAKTLPTNHMQEGSNAFCGGVYDGEKYFVLAPDSAKVVLLSSRDTEETIILDQWPPNFTQDTINFCGGASDGTWIWLAPTTANMIVKVHPLHRQLQGVTADFQAMPRQDPTPLFHGVCTDGEFMYFAPFTLKSPVRVHITSHEVQQLAFPSNFTHHPQSTLFAGCIFDGRSIWMMPQRHAELIQFRPRPPQQDVILQDGTGYSGSLPAAEVRPLPMNVLEWNGTNHGSLSDEGGYLTGLFDAIKERLIVMPLDSSAMKKGLVFVDVNSGLITHQVLQPLPATPDYLGAVYLRDSATLYVCARTELKIIKINVDNGATTTLDIGPPVTKGSETIFSGAAFNGQDAIYFGPMAVSHFVRLLPNKNDAIETPFTTPVDEVSYCGALSDADGSVYFPPHSADNVAKITVGGVLQKFTQWPQTHSFEKTPTSVQFCGGAIGGGRLWMSPLRGSLFGVVAVALQSGAMTYHPLPTTELKTDVTDFGQFVGGVFDGKTVFISCGTATGLVTIDPTTLQISVRETFPYPNGVHKKKLSSNYFRGITFDGRSLWLIPFYGHDGLVQFSPREQRFERDIDALKQLSNHDGVSWSPPLPYDDDASLQPLLNTPLSEEFFVVPKRVSRLHGLVFSHNTRWAYGVPMHTNKVLAINTFSGVVEEFTLPSYFGTSFTGGAFVPPSPSPMTPQGQSRSKPNAHGGTVVLVPHGAKDIVLLNVSTGTFTKIPWPSEAFEESVFYGAFVSSSSVWIIPYVDTKKTRSIPRLMRESSMTTMNVSAVLPPTVLVPATFAIFSGAVGDDQGWLWLVPAAATQLVKLHTNTGQIIVFDTFPFPAELSFHTGVSSKFAGGAFDGRNVWFSPHSASHFLVVDIHNVGAMRLVAAAAGAAPLLLLNMRFDAMGASFYAFPTQFQEGHSLLLKIKLEEESAAAFGGQSIFPQPWVADRDRWRASGFDGKSLWLMAFSSIAPHQANSLRWVDKHKAVYSTSGHSSSGLVFVTNTLDGDATSGVLQNGSPPQQQKLQVRLHDKVPTDDDVTSATTFEHHGTAAFDRNSTIYIIPGLSTFHIVAFNIFSKTSRDIINWPLGVDLGSTGYTGIVFDNHRYMWLAPFDADKVTRIDVTSDGALDIAPITGLNDQKVPGLGHGTFRGGACDNQYVWFVPRATTVIVKINIFDNTLITYPGFDLQSSTTGGTSNFLTMVYDGEQYMWMPPSKADQFVRISTLTGTSNPGIKGFKEWPTELAVNWGADEAFATCTYDHKRRVIWAPPHKASHMIRLDVDSGNMKAISIFYDQLTPNPIISAFTAAVYTGGDSVFIQGRRPLDRNFNNGTSLIRFNVLTETMEQYHLPPNASSLLSGDKEAFQWFGCVFDGASLWQIPRTGRHVAQWSMVAVENTTNIVNTPSATGTVAATTSTSVVPPTMHTTPSHEPTETQFRGSSTRTVSTTVPLLPRSPTASASVTLETQPPPTQQPNTTDGPPTAPPTPSPRVPGRVVKVTTILPGGEEANTAVMTSAGGSAVATSTFAGTGTVSSVARVSAATRMLDCPLAEDDPRPSYFELPLQFLAIGSDEEPTRYFAGAALLSSLLGVFIAGAAVYIERRQCGGPALLKVLGGLSAAHCMYFGPNALSAATTVVAHAQQSTPFIAAVFSFLLVFGVAGYYLFFVVIRSAPRLATTRVAPAEDYDGDATMKFEFIPKCLATGSDTTTTNGNSSNSDEEEEEPSSTSTSNSTHEKQATNSSDSEDSNKASSTSIRQQWFLYHTEPWFDGTANFQRPATRLYSVAEFTSAAIAQILAGLRPADGCTNVAWGILIISLAMLAYLVFIRPYRTRLDTIFSVAVNGIQFTMTAAVLYALRAEVSDEDHLSLKIIEGCLYILVIIYYVQVVVQGYWAYHCGMRRKAALEASQTKHAALLVMSHTVDDGSQQTIKGDEVRLAEPLLSDGGDEQDSVTGSSSSSDEEEEMVAVNPLR